uniref:TPX2 C-terminal domain-containing protein n=1 Tax=Timema douglasi TaxID=61478 RepID=A0A7R8VLM2_TIMDO|nr:unnamed protein product [Timema douglasi]
MENLFDYTVPKCLDFPPNESDDEENDAFFECASTVKSLENPRHQLVDVGNSPELRESKPEEQMEQSLCEILDRVKINENGTKKKNSTPMRIAGPSTTLSSRKEHHMLTRLDKENTPLLSLRSRNVERSLSSAGKVMKTNSSKKNVTQKASQPSCSQPRVTSQLTSFIGSRKRQHSPHIEQPHKYISLAEAVLNFQRCTPRRFHSRKTSHNSKPHKPWVFKSTIPVTPGLTSHLRTRPVHYPTREQEEETAFMEMKKHQVKAYPLNTDIFKQPKLGIRVEAKQHTIPEPFNLTELKKKVFEQEKKARIFHANPVPQLCQDLTKGLFTDVSSTTNKSHTAVNIRHTLSEMCKDWCIPPPTQSSPIKVFIVTDNARNLQAAINGTYWIRRQCFAHTLQLAIKDAKTACPNITQIISKSRAIVGHYSRSSTANARLHAVQKTMDLPALKLIQDVETRWSSEYAMLDRLVCLRKAVAAELASSNSDIDSLSSTEWKLAGGIVEVMRPFAEATTEACGNAYPTASMIIPILHCLEATTLAHIQKNELVSAVPFARSLLKSLKSRFPLYKMDEINALCTIVDPRYKAALFNEEERFHAINLLRQELLSYVAPETQANKTPKTAVLTGSMWDELDKSQDESMKSPFRARPAKVLNQKPFVPKPADRRPLIPVDLVLNTESRSKVREEFNQYLKERDDHIEQLRAEERARQEEKEKREAEEMKKVAESFKARPKPKYRVPNVGSSTKPCGSHLSEKGHNKSDKTNPL